MVLHACFAPPSTTGTGPQWRRSPLERGTDAGVQWRWSRGQAGGDRDRTCGRVRGHLGPARPLPRGLPPGLPPFMAAMALCIAAMAPFMAAMVCRL
eukprot:3272643-Rhodomonas_salina.1